MFISIIFYYTSTSIKINVISCGLVDYINYLWSCIIIKYVDKTDIECCHQPFKTDDIIKKSVIIK